MNMLSLKNFILNVAGIYILWIIMHYISANLYPEFCCEKTIWGFLKSAFVAEAPHCVALRWVINNGGNVIHNMWITLGIWFSSKFLINILNK